MEPLVSIICLCYNHRTFVEESVTSAIKQDYSNIEVIIVDDASTDGSQEVILSLKEKYPELRLILQKENTGNCRAFNNGAAEANGDFLIDLAADDVLFNNRVSLGVKDFIMKGPSYGVCFSNALIIDELGNIKKNFYQKVNGRYQPEISEGGVFEDLLRRYFICPPTLMFRKSVFNDLDGYDESLAYEDFDFMLRASKLCSFFYTDEILVKRREVAGSLSTRQYKRGSKQLKSTYSICKKAFELAETKAELNALRWRIKYEGAKAIQLGELALAMKYLGLYYKKSPLLK